MIYPFDEEHPQTLCELCVFVWICSGGGSYGKVRSFASAITEDGTRVGHRWGDSIGDAVVGLGNELRAAGFKRLVHCPGGMGYPPDESGEPLPVPRCLWEALRLDKGPRALLREVGKWK